MSPENVMPIMNEETRKKLFGDFSDEVPEASYRLFANQFARRIQMIAAARLKERYADDAEKIVGFMHTEVGQAIFSFVLAASVELVPMQILTDERRRLAYNLRVQAYEEVGGLFMKLAGLYEEELKALPPRGLGSSRAVPTNDKTAGGNGGRTHGAEETLGAST